MLFIKLRRFISIKKEFAKRIKENNPKYNNSNINIIIPCDFEDFYKDFPPKFFGFLNNIDYKKIDKFN